MRISVLVCTRLKNGLFFDCIRSIRKFTSPETLAQMDFRICNTDIENPDSTSRIHSFMSDEIGLPFQTVVSEYNFSKCNNLLSRLTDAEYLLFLNDDVEFVSDAITHMLKELENDSQMGQVGLKLKYPNGLVQHHGQLLIIDQFRNMVGVTHLDIGKSSEISDHDDIPAQGVTAACCMVRGSDFHAVGGFDEGYESAFQDVQLSWQIRKLGKKVECVGMFSAIHHESVSRGRNDICRGDVVRMVEYFNSNREVILDGSGRYWKTIVQVRQT